MKTSCSGPAPGVPNVPRKKDPLTPFIEQRSKYAVVRPLYSVSLAANPGFSGGYIVFPGPPLHPCPEPHARDQPLQSEAPNARNAGKSTITGMCTAAFDPTGGVPQPAPFPIAKSGLPSLTSRRTGPKRVNRQEELN